MDVYQIVRVLSEAENAAESSQPVAGTGFWRVVRAVKTDPDLVDALADRIGAVDQRAFRAWAWLVVPLWVGNAVMVVGTVLGLLLIGQAYSLTGFWATVAFLAGFGALLVTTHGLGHLVVGAAVGIRFTGWFIGTIRMPQPGVKIDYASYLRAPARSRAWMHASGAIVTKLVPFALIGAAIASGIPVWVTWLLVLVGVATIITDIRWSTTSSDWKKFQREMRFAQSS